jgi:hypothetical protein
MADDASQDGGRDANPLSERVDALLKRMKPERKAGEVPVLTEVVADEMRRRAAGVDRAALEKIAYQLEHAVLDRLGPEVERLLEEKLASKLSAVLDQSIQNLRAELTVSVRQMVREAVAASVASALKSEPQ